MESKRHNKRTKVIFNSMDNAIKTIRNELIQYDYQTTRGFWVGGTKYIARKTNKLSGYVNLTIRKG